MYRCEITKQSQNRLALLRTLLNRTDLAPLIKEDSPMGAMIDSPIGDEQMLSMILSDALKGVDIPSQYPAFFRKLQTDADMRASFLEALDILEMSALTTLEALPLPPSEDMSFLTGAPVAHTVKRKGTGGREVSWTQTVAYLQDLFFPPDLLTDTVFRSGMDYLEEPTFNLFLGETRLEDTTVTALLEARQPFEEPDVLHLFLQVALQGDVDESARLPKLRAHLKWAEYQASAQVDDKGQANFPKIPLAAVIVEADERIRSNLQLTIEGL